VAMTASMLWGIVVMTFGFWAYAIAITLVRVRVIIRARERAAPWEARFEERVA
jgi:heme exporter protein C